MSQIYHTNKGPKPLSDPDIRQRYPVSCESNVYFSRILFYHGSIYYVNTEILSGCDDSVAFALKGYFTFNTLFILLLPLFPSGEGIFFLHVEFIFGIMILDLILTVELDQGVFVIIITEYLTVVRGIDGNIRTMPDKACNRQTHCMEIDPQPVLKLNALGGSRSGLTYLDVLDVRLHMIDIAYFL